MLADVRRRNENDFRVSNLNVCRWFRNDRLEIDDSRSNEKRGRRRRGLAARLNDQLWMLQLLLLGLQRRRSRFDVFRRNRLNFHRGNVLKTKRFDTGILVEKTHVGRGVGNFRFVGSRSGNSGEHVDDERRGVQQRQRHQFVDRFSNDIFDRFGFGRFLVVRVVIERLGLIVVIERGLSRPIRCRTFEIVQRIFPSDFQRMIRL